MGSETIGRVEAIEALTKKSLWLASWMIHHANHIRPNVDGVKVGGHQASSASMAALLSTLYFGVLKPEDRVAVKPHAAPVFHAIQYLMGRQSREKLIDFRAFGGAQSYPSRTKDTDDVDFSTGSVGLGVAFSAFASMIQDYVRAKDWARKDVAEGRMIALAGDAELDEGNIYECLLEGWKHGLRNCWWIIDYNRQSLDGVVREGLYERIEAIFSAFGWTVVTLKYGALQRAAFAEPGGEQLKAWINACPNALYSALMFRGGAAWRERLSDEIGDQGPVSALLARRTDEELAALMANLGGHCVESLLEQFEAAGSDQPTVFIAYTVKGWGTPLAGHKDNHAGQMTAAQMAQLQAAHKVRAGHEWEKLEGLEKATALEAFLATVPFNSEKSRRLTSPAVPTIGPQFIGTGATSTQAAFGKILDAIARTDSPLAQRIVTTSPDVTVSTNLGAWVNRRNLFASDEMADLFQKEAIPSTQKWRFGPDGQHMELGIAEMNLFLMLGAAGLSHSLFGERLLPIGTLYDPFIARGLDALNYACYQDARFLLVATPSGVSLAGEGGAHQSISSPLIGMAQDGLASFEPAFADELAVIMDWAFDYMQRSGDARPDLADWPRDVTGGSVYLRLSTRALEQVPRQVDADLSRNIIRGAYWLKPPTPECTTVIAYQGVLASEAIAAAAEIGGDRRNVAVLAVTSADRLNAGWQAAQRGRLHGESPEPSHIEALLAEVPQAAGIVTAIDAHPATLGWLGSVLGHRTMALGVEHFGQTGTVNDLYRHFDIDARAIVQAARAATGRR
ncbi:transketolase [Devosia sp. 63-57]|uniref:transketolase n=1 Tax=Devosia sp. 63-57 TaxID=1895751 RepID=UPI00086C0A2F|nr:transketolase [Devosia sp. 63-57]ODT47912.1 MAG: transketolase [Pelagibacterium sp. SCN 63-126]ODU87882.1 MAG: transketolase [Pelagibacterium sp. SCN 63-17]OJX42377.1 MAG: transketolase [Devosia sp. 63-57]